MAREEAKTSNLLEEKKKKAFGRISKFLFKKAKADEDVDDLRAKIDRAWEKLHKSEEVGIRC